MITHARCPVPWCCWSHQSLATAAETDDDDAVPPWCTATWAVAPVIYGPPLTDRDVVGAHVATHSPAELLGRLPSREQLEASRIALQVPQAGRIRQREALDA